MKSALASVTFAISCLCAQGAGAAPQRPAPVPPPEVVDGPGDPEILAAALNRFGLELFEAAAPGEGNACTSPTSVAFALMLAQLGAEGNTARELAELLESELPQWPASRTRTAARDLLAHLLQRDPELEISIVNDIWPQEGHPLRQDYVTRVAEVFDAEVRTVDYQRDAEGARKRINTYVAKHTKDRIVDLIPRGLLDPTTLLVLTNAVYFKGKWAIPFEPSVTTPRPFHLADGTEVKVETMVRVGTMALAQVDGGRVLQLPYRDDHQRYVMEIYLPDDGKGTADLIHSLTTARRFQPTLVRLQLPRFTIRSEYQLVGPLRRLGLRDATHPGRADFSGIDDGKGQLFIGEVIHKTFLEVGETGTEAAAATAVVVRAGAAAGDRERDPTVFDVDRPFLCTIRDRDSGLLLFVTRVADPR